MSPFASQTPTFPPKKQVSPFASQTPTSPPKTMKDTKNVMRHASCVIRHVVLYFWHGVCVNQLCPIGCCYENRSITNDTNERITRMRRKRFKTQDSRRKTQDVGHSSMGIEFAKGALTEAGKSIILKLHLVYSGDT